MTSRVEILSTHTNRTNIKVREVVVEKNGETGALTITPIDQAYEHTVIPGQRCALHAGETKGRAILITDEIDG